ncbi:MAG: hypothetical protein WAP35_05090 [Solirubrobacterales bacterium]
MEPFETADRADRLGASMSLLGIVYEHPRDALRRLEAEPFLTEDEWSAWRRTDDRDIELASACLNAEFELRNRQWDALERLGAAFATGDAATMPEAEARKALAAVIELGWALAPPEE